MSEKPRILSVDDNPTNLEIVEETLGSECIVRSVSSGDEALVVARDWRPDIVLLDIMMPGLDGYETCRRMREHPVRYPCKIILVSAKAMVSERLRGYEAGADDYVVKPFEPSELTAKVRVFHRLKHVEELDRMKSDILTLLAHETRTPLATLEGALALLAGEESTDPRHQDLLLMAMASGNRLLEMLEKAALLAELRSSRFVPDFERVALDLLLDEALARARDQAAARNIRFETDIPAGIEVLGSVHMLKHLADILLDNAVKHSPDGGVIEVGVRGDGSSLIARVADHGDGIPADLAASVFEPFMVRDIDHHQRGHGFSLALARDIVVQHGGRIDVDSAPGRGACFLVRLPCLEAGVAGAHGSGSRPDDVAA